MRHEGHPGIGSISLGSSWGHKRNFRRGPNEIDNEVVVVSMKGLEMIMIVLNIMMTVAHRIYKSSPNSRALSPELPSWIQHTETDQGRMNRCYFNFDNCASSFFSCIQF